MFISRRFWKQEQRQKGRWKSWSWCWPKNSSTAHQSTWCPRARLSPWAACVDPVLPVLPELPSRSAHPSRAWTEVSAPSPPVEVHTVFQQCHCGPVFTEPALPQHLFILSPLHTSVSQAEVGSGLAHCRAPLAPWAFPQSAAVVRFKFRRTFIWKRLWFAPTGSPQLLGFCFYNCSTCKSHQLPCLPTERSTSGPGWEDCGSSGSFH